MSAQNTTAKSLQQKGGIHFKENLLSALKNIFKVMVCLRMRKNIRTPSEDFWTWIANLQKKYWIIYILLVRLSAVWFSLFLTYLGNVLGFTGTDEQGGKYLTLWGWLATIFILTVIVLGEISVAISKKKDDEENAEGRRKNEYYKRGYLFQNRLREKHNKLCKQRCRVLLGKIHAIKANGKTNSSVVVCKPKKQLETIVSELNSCLLPFFEETSGEEKWQEDDIYISIAYQFPAESDEWEWATEERGLGFAELLAASSPAQGQSTFSYLLNSEENSIFLNSKEMAFKEKHYIPDDLDRRDRNHNLLGSIACYKQVQKIHDTIYTRFILTVTSYSKRFVAGDSENDIETAEHNVFDLVISDFLKRINEELCWLYLQQLDKP